MGGRRFCLELGRGGVEFYASREFEISVVLTMGLYAGATRYPCHLFALGLARMAKSGVTATNLSQPGLERPLRRVGVDCT
jgi:hypothetical protein